MITQYKIFINIINIYTKLDSKIFTLVHNRIINTLREELITLRRKISIKTILSNIIIIIKSLIISGNLILDAINAGGT